MNYKVLSAIVATLTERKETLGLAESCTGGLLSSYIVAIAGVSAVFKGSFVCYSNEFKRDILNVPFSLIEQHTAISNEVAVSMAKNVQKLLGVHWALAVTGIAGPDGGSSESPVGTVWISLYGPDFELTQKHCFMGDRQQIRESASIVALDMLYAALIK